jgi:hypothetical protein
VGDRLLIVGPRAVVVMEFEREPPREGEAPGHQRVSPGGGPGDCRIFRQKSNKCPSEICVRMNGTRPTRASTAEKACSMSATDPASCDALRRAATNGA